VALVSVEKKRSTASVDDMEEMTEKKLADDPADDIAEDLFADTSSDEDDESMEEPVHGVSVDKCFVLDMDSGDEHESDEFLFHSFSASQTASEVLSALVERVAMLV
jgi:hypothetical protein